MVSSLNAGTMKQLSLSTFAQHYVVDMPAVILVAAVSIIVVQWFERKTRESLVLGSTTKI